MTRKWTLLGLVALGVGALGLVGCDEDEVQAPPQEVSITVTPSSVPPLNVGQTVQLVAQVSGTTNTAVNWTTSNAQVATVSATGLVTAVGAGSATITATALADTTKKAAVLITVNAPPAVSITLLPSAATLFIGDSLPLVATVTGSTNTAVTFRTSNAAVATVSATGLVRAVGAGTAIITAVAQADTTKKAQSTITVNAPPEPTVAIKSITQGGTTNPVDPSNVAGTIDVTVEYSAPAGSRVTRIAVLVDGTEACAQTVSTSPAGEAQPAAEFVCSFNTAAYTVASGATTATVRFPNGTRTITARLTRSGGLPSRDASTTVTFNNADAFLALVTTTNTGATARDAAGLLWTGNSDVVVQAIPIIYSTGSGAAISRVTISLGGLFCGGAARTSVRSDTTAADGFSVTFPKTAACGGTTNGVKDANTGAAGITTGAGGIQVASIRADGSNGPAAFVNGVDTDPSNDILLRLDNEPPRPGTFAFTNQSATVACCEQNWIGASITFESFYDPATETDAPFNPPGSGVGGLTHDFRVGAATATDATIRSTGTLLRPTDAVGQFLTGTTANNVYAAIVRVQDALGNETVARLQASPPTNPVVVGAGAAFGVDLIPPTIAYDATSVADLAINPPAPPGPGTQFIVNATDVHTDGTSASGIGANGILYTNFRNYTQSTGTCIAGGFSPTLGRCSLAASAAPLTVTPDATASYQHLGDGVNAVFARDRAGNTSPILPQRTVLVDATAPTTQNIVFPPSLGGTVTFSMAASDNVDLDRWSFQLRFGAVDLPFGPFRLYGDGVAFNAARATSGTLSETFLFVRSLETPTPADAPSGTLQAVTHALGLTEDVAGNVATQVNAFAGGIPPGANSATSRNVLTFLVSAPAAAQNINNGRTGVGAPVCPAGTPTVRQLSAAVTGPSGFPNPWSVVHFYVIDGGAVRWVAQATSPASVSDNGANRTYTFTVNLDASNAFASALASRRSIAAQANLPVFAVGVDADGDALKTNNNTNLSVCNQS